MKYYCVSDSGEDECASTFIVTYFMQKSIKKQIEFYFLFPSYYLQYQFW